MTDARSRYAALAVPHRTANAVGGVVLTLEDERLRIELVDVRPHTSGFAAGRASRRSELVVPYQAVRGLVREGRLLLLSLDPAVIAPYCRFALARFRRDDALELGRAARWRARLVVATWVLPALATAATLARLARGGAALDEGLALAALVGAASWFVLRWASAFMLWGGAESERLRDELEGQLAARLGLGFVEPREHRDEPAPEAVVEALALVSRPRWLAPAVIVALSGSVAAAVALERYGIARVVRLPVVDAARGLVAPLPALAAAARVAVTPASPGCRCERADSPLWSRPPPRVAIVAVPRRGALESPWLSPDAVVTFPHGGRERVELDVAVINDSSAPLEGVGLILTFWRRKGSERRNVIERALSWDHELAPGKSIRWRVKARGNALRITPQFPSAVGDPGYAPADAFAKLAEGGSTAVRLHAATMLGYLGDPRAEGVARALEGLSPVEEAARAALAATFAPLVACEVDGVKACVVNRSGRLARGVSLTGAGGSRTEVRDLFFPRQGLRVPFAGAAPPLLVEPLGPSDAPPP